MQSADDVELRARHRGCLHVVFVVVALPIFGCGDRSTDCAVCHRRDNGGLFVHVVLEASLVGDARRRDDLDASVMNEATDHTGIERDPGARRFVSRRDCRGVSTHHMHHSVESRGGMSLLDCVTSNTLSERLRADGCLVFCSSLLQDRRRGAFLQGGGPVPVPVPTGDFTSPTHGTAERASNKT